jgi:aminoglycoside phosphotransferase (APT) family kinase protein
MVDRPWMLFEDSGPTLRATRPDGTGDHDLGAWERILAEYAALQRSVERMPVRDEMLLASVPDQRAGRLGRELARLVEDDAIWARITPEERAPANTARVDLREATEVVAGAIAELETAGVAASIQHDDFPGGNILVGPHGDRFFDWGDAVVAHPFSTLTTTFNSIAHHTGRSLDDAVFVRLRDVYTEAWTDRLSRADLSRVVDLAQVLGCIARSCAGHGDAVAGWLI